MAASEKIVKIESVLVAACLRLELPAVFDEITFGKLHLRFDSGLNIADDRA